MAGHQPDCRWQQTPPEECQYRRTHHYCPHAEHACTCPPKPTMADDLALALSLLDECAAEPETCSGPDCCFDSKAHALLVRHGIRQDQP